MAWMKACVNTVLTLLVACERVHYVNEIGENAHVKREANDRKSLTK